MNKEMTGHILGCTLLMLSFLSCQTNDQRQNQYLDNATIEKIDRLGNRYLELNRFSGTIVIAKGKTIVYHQSFGFADDENKLPFADQTAFKIGGLTKMITAHLLDRLVRDGKIKRTDRFAKYLPEMELEVSVNDLILQETDTSYHALGKLIEKVSEQTYQENIEKYSEDLGLENTYFDRANANVAIGYLYHNYRDKGLELEPAPSYLLEEAFSSRGLKSTGRDLVKIIHANPQELKLSGYLQDDGFSYSLVNNKASNISVIILSNRRHPVGEEMSNIIFALLAGKAYQLPLSRKPYAIDKAILKDYTGNYSINQNTSFDVLHSNDSLFVSMGLMKIRLVPQSPNQFYMEQRDAAMRFMRDSTGVVKTILLLNGFMDSDEKAVRTE
ncbi:MAG: serine hydrolase domain-containing protein [Bacteroidota bacterium]